MALSEIAHTKIMEQSVRGRYIVNADILRFLKNVPEEFAITTAGKSVLDEPIKTVTLGRGPKKVLMWSQMHGNESTTTKAVLDLINFLSVPSILSEGIKSNCTIKIIPILNPDGAAAYTRTNANEIDLNRDAQKLNEPESGILRKVYNDFKPDYCFNLHDQRTIFNVGDTNKPATVSFLAPAHDTQRTVSETRAISMQLIVAMNKVLQQLIPGQIGRYDDAFNNNCVGDTFQVLRTPTILFEAGHFPDDYTREKTREYIFYALITAMDNIANDRISDYTVADYFKIPENGKLFFDILIKNAQKLGKGYPNGTTIGILYREILENGTVVLKPKIEKTGTLDSYYGHMTYNCLNSSDLENLMQETALIQLL